MKKWASHFAGLISGYAGMLIFERFIEKSVHPGGGHLSVFGVHYRLMYILL